MNKYGEFVQITSDVLSRGTVDWSALRASSLSSLLGRMAKTDQNERYHAEKDVLSHTVMVCEQITAQAEYVNGSNEDKTILFWSALLHDIGKTVCTCEQDGEIRSPHHASKGANMARAFLWRELGLCGSYEKQRLREAICTLIRYHSFPPYAIKCEDADLRLLKIASNGELAPGATIAKLCALERADALGRIYHGDDDISERIEFCKTLAEDIPCYTRPYDFADDFSKRAYFKGKTLWRDHGLFNDTWGSVILMSGLPGTGKDTYIREKYPHLPVISLDDIRRELGISPTEKQGRVISEGHDRARRLLRKKQPFVWNATNITRQTRNMQISLFEDYGASVTTVFLETEWEEQLSRNAARDASVPEAVIQSLLEKLVLPERYESERVVWQIV